MTVKDDDQNVEPKDDKVSEALSLLSKKIDEQGEQHKQNISAVDKKISDLAPDEPDESWEPNDGDDEEVIVKKSELKTIVDTAVKRATDAATKAVDKKVSSTLSAKQKRDEMDVQAMKDFPYLHDASPDFNERFVKEVQEEMKRKVDSGRNNQDPELLYDASAVVAQRGRKAGWLVTQDDAERDLDRSNARGESFSVSRRKPDDAGKPSASQIAYATKLGLSDKRFSELFEKTGKGRMNSIDSLD